MKKPGPKFRPGFSQFANVHRLLDSGGGLRLAEREFLIDNLLVRIHLIIETIVERLRQRSKENDFPFSRFPDLICTTIFETTRFMTFTTF